MVRRVVGLILHGEDQLSYFSFQPVLHDWCSDKEGNVLFNDPLNTFYFIYGYMASRIAREREREETRCRHMGYSFRLAASFFLISLIPQTG